MFDDRNPIATYERAIWRLVQFQIDDRCDDDQLKFAISIVADVFWLSDAKVMYDLRRADRSINIAPKQHRRYQREVY